MTLTILSPGVQTSLQGALRTGLRHMGMPWAGPADPLSMALANRLVSNRADATALEITFGGFEARFEQDALIALTGAPAAATLDGLDAPYHTALTVKRGQSLKLLPPAYGARTYLALAGGFQAREVFGSKSTYLPAGLGGHDGRALMAGDELGFQPPPSDLPQLETPLALRPHISNSIALRACTSAETGRLTHASLDRLFGDTFTASAHSNRMGIRLSGAPLGLTSDGKMKSAAMFPGTVQCPEDGNPIILLADGGTTGGYPRIAHVAACDRHLLGQIRPGDQIRFLRRTHEDAIADHKAKSDLLKDWLA